jgi:hypothetical protein
MCAFKDAILAENDLFHIGGVREVREDHIHLFGNFFRRVCRRRPFGSKLVNRTA